MKHTIQEIYCDEAGFTSSNLLDEAQPYFAYATVAVDDSEAKECVDRVLKDYRIQGSELKGQKLLKHSRGQQAIEYILSHFKDKIKVAVFHKKFNLACKFFEYIFEPVISEKNYLFYRINFHRFISNILWCHFNTRSEYAEEIFRDFQKFMRNLDDEGLNYLFSSLTLPSISPVLDCIRTFCVSHRRTINEELDSLKGTGTGKWTLDLTTTALFSLLGEWGQEFHQLKVFCDSSQPLQANIEIFNTLIGREDTLFMDMLGKEEPMTFNLAQEIKLVESHRFAGIQIADVAAAACTYALREGHNQNNASWYDYLHSILSDRSVIPDLKYVDLNSIQAKSNWILLIELAERSVNQQPLLDGIVEFLNYVNSSLYLGLAE